MFLRERGKNEPKKSLPNTKNTNDTRTEDNKATIWLVVLLEKNNETGIENVRVTAIKQKTISDKNFAKTISSIVTGKDNSNSSVFKRFSSLKSLIATVGTKINSNQTRISKNCLIDPSPTKNMSLTNTKDANIPKRVAAIYPNGLLK